MTETYCDEGNTLREGEYYNKRWQIIITTNYNKKLSQKILQEKVTLYIMTIKWVTYRDTGVW